MKHHHKILGSSLLALSVALAAAPALASDDCEVPVARWQSREAVRQMAVQKGRSARPDIEVGVCGEHGGDPDSIGFFHRAGLDYVSCSPFRVPIARLAAAQAAIAK